MKLYSYVIDHYYGFAPNPFYGVCTLATCKPAIREHAALGDYVVGTGCARRKRRGYLVYFMLVEEVTTYNETGPSPGSRASAPSCAVVRCVLLVTTFITAHSKWRMASGNRSTAFGTAALTR